ncbi:hypothetical protein C8R44DRAFT_923344 [Mycena epipterygia]|nr:hypothetical protein C8R44DRAFT_923344 [Mycena epipterygia]
MSRPLKRPRRSPRHPCDELPKHFSAPLRQEEEEDGELEDVPPPPPPPAKPAKAPPAPKPRPAQAKPAPQHKPSKKAPPPPPPADADEEEMEFGLPATKRMRRSPPVTAALSFPDSSASAWDDWDEVPAALLAAPDADVPQEIDMNEFELTLEAEMEAEMEADADGDEEEQEEDFLASVLPQVPDSAATPIRPMSMGEDEYSSSEDSDDD